MKDKLIDLLKEYNISEKHIEEILKCLKNDKSISQMIKYINCAEDANIKLELSDFLYVSNLMGEN